MIDAASWFPMYPSCPLKEDVCKHCPLYPQRQEVCLKIKFSEQPEKGLTSGEKCAILELAWQ